MGSGQGQGHGLEVGSGQGQGLEVGSGQTQGRVSQAQASMRVKGLCEVLKKNSH